MKSNFGSSDSPEANLVCRASQIVKEKDPALVCDGEVQGILAFNKEKLYFFGTVSLWK